MKFDKIMHIVKVVMAVALVSCLFRMPYDYYTLVRFLALVVFAIIAYQYHLRKNAGLMVVFIALAILFQPLFKITLSRAAWNIIDIIVAALLLYLMWKERREEHTNKE